MSLGMKYIRFVDCLKEYCKRYGMGFLTGLIGFLIVFSLIRIFSYQKELKFEQAYLRGILEGRKQVRIDLIEKGYGEYYISNPTNASVEFRIKPSIIPLSLDLPDLPYLPYLTDLPDLPPEEYPVTTTAPE